MHMETIIIVFFMPMVPFSVAIGPYQLTETQELHKISVRNSGLFIDGFFSTSDPFS